MTLFTKCMTTSQLKNYNFRMRDACILMHARTHAHTHTHTHTHNCDYYTVTRFAVQGRKDEEVRGDEPQKLCLITQNKTVQTKRKQSLCALLRGCSLSLSLRARYCPPTAGRRDPFQLSPAITGIRYRC